MSNPSSLPPDAGMVLTGMQGGRPELAEDDDTLRAEDGEPVGRSERDADIARSRGEK